MNIDRISSHGSARENKKIQQLFQNHFYPDLNTCVPVQWTFLQLIQNHIG